jgi:RNA polymerase sigma factor (sigma-70 family)
VNRAAADLVLDHIRSVVDADTGPTDAQLLERFAARGEEAAFALLLRRHGRLVWGVCRRILRHAHDAEDAFQATFLVLARQAATVRKQSSVGSWLYGVASRLSWQLRKRLARRSTEALGDRVDASGQPEPHQEVSLREALTILDEEVAQLPEKYRGPIVLCHLQGKTTEEAARELGSAVGTLRTRLVRARELLQGRLRRRGIAAPAVAITVLAAAEIAGAAVPPTLPPRTLGAALSFVGWGSGAISVETLHLARGLLRSSLMQQLKWWALGLAALALLGGGATAILPTGPSDTPRAEADPPQPGEKAEPGPVAARDATDLHRDPLPVGALARLGTVRFRHGARVNCASVSPDGQLLATAGQDGNVRLWEVATGSEVGVLTKERTNLCCAVFSPDGKTLAVGGEETIRLWDVAARRVLWEQKQQRGQNDLAFAPDGKSLTAAGPDGGLRRWDTATGKPLQDSAPAPIHCLYGTVPLRDGQSVITAVFECRPGKESNVQAVLSVREVATGKVLRRLGEAGVPAYTVYHASFDHGQLIALSPDDTTLAVVSENQGVHAVTLYDLATGKEQRRLQIQEGEISCLAFAPDGKTIAAGDKQGHLHLWESKTGKELLTLAAHPDALRTMLFLPGGKELATLSDDGVIRLWDPGTGKEARPRDGCLSAVSSLAVPADGKAVFTGGQESVVRRWDPATGKELGRFEGIAGGAYGIACSADGKTLAAADQQYEIALWDVASGKVVRRWTTGPDHNAELVAFAPDGKSLATSGMDGFVGLWDPSTGKELRRMKTGHHYFSKRLAFSSDGKLLAASNQGVMVRLWETATGNERLVIEVGNEPAEALAFAPDGSLLAAACRDGHVRVYETVPEPAKKISLISRLEDGQSATVEVATAKELHRLEGPGHQGCAVAFSPDGRLLAAGGGDGMVHLWDTATWRPRGVLRGHKGHVTAVAFLSNERLVSASADTTVLVWDVAAAP